jgi:hypothetical protein
MADKTAGKGASQNMDSRLYGYLLRHTREAKLLADLRCETAQKFPQAAHMAVSPDQGAFLAWLVRTLGAKRVLEVGVFTGYSSVAMALALPEDGRLVACDRDPKAMEVARSYWQQAGVTDKVRQGSNVLEHWKLLSKCCLHLMESNILAMRRVVVLAANVQLSEHRAHALCPANFVIWTGSLPCRLMSGWALPLLPWTPC